MFLLGEENVLIYPGLYFVVEYTVSYLFVILHLCTMTAWTYNPACHSLWD